MQQNSRYVPVSRNVAILSISEVLDLNYSITEQIMVLKPLRLLRTLCVEKKGILINLPQEFSVFLREIPELKSEINYINYVLNKNGKLESHIHCTDTAHLPPKCVFDAKAGGVIGHDEAGIAGAKFSGYE